MQKDNGRQTKNMYVSSVDFSSALSVADSCAVSSLSVCMPAIFGEKHSKEKHAKYLPISSSKLMDFSDGGHFKMSQTHYSFSVKEHTGH